MERASAQQSPINTGAQAPSISLILPEPVCTLCRKRGHLPRSLEDGYLAYLPGHPRRAVLDAFCSWARSDLQL
jgi:hypothetical protein